MTCVERRGYSGRQLPKKWKKRNKGNNALGRRKSTNECHENICLMRTFIKKWPLTHTWRISSERISLSEHLWYPGHLLKQTKKGTPSSPSPKAEKNLALILLKLISFGERRGNRNEVLKGWSFMYMKRSTTNIFLLL